MGEELIRWALAEEARCAPDTGAVWTRMQRRLARGRRWRAAGTTLVALGVVLLAAGLAAWWGRGMAQPSRWL